MGQAQHAAHCTSVCTPAHAAASPNLCPAATTAPPTAAAKSRAGAHASALLSGADVVRQGTVVQRTLHRFKREGFRFAGKVMLTDDAPVHPTIQAASNR